MNISPFVNFRADCYRELEEWAKQAYAKFEAAIATIINAEVISDEDFSETLRMLMVASGCHTATEFSKATAFGSAVISEWLSGKNLPVGPKRKLVLELSYVALQVESELSVIQQMVKVANINAAPPSLDVKTGQLKEDYKEPTHSLFSHVSRLPGYSTLTIRARNGLSNGNITLLGDLISKFPEDMLGMGNFGHKSLNDIAAFLEELNASLATTIPENHIWWTYQSLAHKWNHKLEHHRDLDALTREKLATNGYEKLGQFVTCSEEEWSRLSKELGEVHVQDILNFLRRHELELHMQPPEEFLKVVAEAV